MNWSSKFNKKSCSSNFILQLIQVKIDDFNTFLTQGKVQSLSILRLRDTQINRGCVLFEIQELFSPLRHVLDQVVNHLCWYSHSLLLESLKQLAHICRGIHSALNTSLQLTPSAFVLGLSLGTGKAWKGFWCCWWGTVWCGVLHGVWWCHVDVQCEQQICMHLYFWAVQYFKNGNFHLCRTHTAAGDWKLLNITVQCLMNCYLRLKWLTCCVARSAKQSSKPQPLPSKPSW